MKTRGRRSGFTLIEILVFIAIFSIIIVSFITILTTVTQLQVRQSSAAYVAEQSQSLIQQIQYYIENTRLVVLPTNNTSSNVMIVQSFATSSVANPGVYDGIFSLDGGVYFLQDQSLGNIRGAMTGLGEGGNSITSGKVTVSGLSFVHHHVSNSSPEGTEVDSVLFSFTMAAGMPHTSQFYSQSFQSSATVLTPAPAIAPAQWVGFIYTGVNFIDPPYDTIAAVESSNFNSITVVPGDLLIAVVQTTPATTLTASNTPDTWTKIADLPYDNSELSVFDATAISTSSNHSIEFILGTSSVTESGMFFYDYHGAATSSPFVASSSQVQSDTQTPDSGRAYSTSTVGLVIGITLNTTTPEIPSPQAGFTLESESEPGTPMNVYVEDQTRALTGPVSAGWQYSQTTPSSSLSLILTFK